MISTERLDLRLVGDQDVDLILALFSDPLVARWSGTGQVMTNRDEAVARVDRYRTRGGDLPGAGIFVVRRRDVGQDIGIAILAPLPASTGVDREDVEIGWHFLPSAWGQGFATEAGRAMVDRGFAHGCDELIAVTHPDNERSQAVCRRLGMSDLGLRDDWYDTTTRAFRLRP